MRIALVGASPDADAVAFAAGKTGIELSGWFMSADCVVPESTDVAMLFTQDERLESEAEILAEKGVCTVVPGTVLADKALVTRLDEVFAEKGLKLATLFFEKYFPNVADVARVINDGCIGKIGVIDHYLAWPCPGASALKPLAQALYTVSYWMGFPVTAMGSRTKIEKTDCAAVTARFENGALLNLQAVCTAGCMGYQTVYELSGTDGNISYDASKARPVVRTDDCAPQPLEKYPLIGTTVCPIAKALRDLPCLLAEQEVGLSREGRILANIIDKAFAKGV